MSDFQFKTPVVLVLFNRPHTTEKVFQSIRRAKPSQLFLVADGPRPDRPDDIEKCRATRAVVAQVDWDCQVFQNYSDINLGCGKRLPTGLDWVFDQVEEAIILEDDCVPHPTFFRFCDELLEHYRDDQRVASISGQNVQFGQLSMPNSYYFSRYNHCWGWATWKRAWRYFDPAIKIWSQVQTEHLLYDILQDTRMVRYWSHLLQGVYDGTITTVWDYQWTLACWLQNSLGILSSTNLISNVGDGIDSTHFKSQQIDPHLHLPTVGVDFPLRHPPLMVRHTKADRFTHETLFDPPLFNRVQKKMNKVLSVFR
jgi:hypothetical protein